MEVKGKVKVVNSTVVISEKFAKREFVITDESMYPQDILFQLTQDKVSLADPLTLGQEVTVHYNLRGKEYVNQQGEVKYFNTLDCWKIDSNGAF